MTAHLILRTEALDEHRTRQGLTKAQDLAAAMKVSEATLSRVLNGKSEPGPKFIAGSLAAFPGVTFSELFEVA